jgi:hypothetical protein
MRKKNSRKDSMIVKIKKEKDKFGERGSLIAKGSVKA